MRHGKRIKKIGRTAAHRKATLAAMSTALIQHKRITTTYTKAKALRGFVEPLLNRAKSDTVHNRRQVFRHLQDKEAVTTLFDEVAEKIGDRSGGYTRVIKLGRRQGDGAEVALIELVDYNDVKPDGSSGDQKRKTRRGGRRKTSDSEAPTPVETAAVATEAAATPEAAEAVSEELAAVTEDAVEAVDQAESAVEEVAEQAVEEVAELADNAFVKSTPETEVTVLDDAEVAEDSAEDTDSAEEAPEAEADQEQPVSEEGGEDEAEGESAVEEESEEEEEDDDTKRG